MPGFCNGKQSLGCSRCPPEHVCVLLIAVLTSAGMKEGNSHELCLKYCCLNMYAAGIELKQRVLGWFLSLFESWFLDWWD